MSVILEGFPFDDICVTFLTVSFFTFSVILARVIF
jgi:hypothetical protein